MLIGYYIVTNQSLVNFKDSPFSFTLVFFPVHVLPGVTIVDYFFGYYFIFLHGFSASQVYGYWILQNRKGLVQFIPCVLTLCWVSSLIFLFISSNLVSLTACVLVICVWMGFLTFAGAFGSLFGRFIPGLVGSYSFLPSSSESESLKNRSSSSMFLVGFFGFGVLPCQLVYNYFIQFFQFPECSSLFE